LRGDLEWGVALLRVPRSTGVEIDWCERAGLAVQLDWFDFIDKVFQGKMGLLL